MARSWTLHEITRERFWKLEDYLNSAEGQEKFGQIKVEYRGDAKIYRNSEGKALLSSRDGYFAHHTLEAAAGK